MKAGCGLAALGAFFFAVMLPVSAADDFLDPLGLEFRTISPRVVQVIPYPDQRIWVNGVRVYTHDPSHEAYIIRVGDVVDECESGRFHRYRLIALEGTEATLTRSTYACHEAYLGGGQTRLSSGDLIRTERMTVNLAAYALVDWDPVLRVETSGGHIYHSKAP